MIERTFHSDPRDWGWDTIRGNVFPALTAFAAAPGEFCNVHVFRHNCKTWSNIEVLSQTLQIVCVSRCGQWRVDKCMPTL